MTRFALLRRSALPFAAALLPLQALAQATPVDTVVVTHPVQPELFFAAIAGIILAFAFQLVFTLMSLAGGLSLTPNIMKHAAKHKADRLAAGHPLHIDDEDKGLPEHHTAMSNVVVHELGIWVLVTTSVALFLATWLSMRLSFLGTDEYRYVLALVVWAAYLSIVTYLEWKSVKTLAGGLIGIALAGLHTGKEVLHGLLHKSPEARLEDFGRKTMKHLYADLSHAASKSKVDKKLVRYLADLKPQSIDYDRIHKEIAQFIAEAKNATGAEPNINEVVNRLAARLERPHPLFTGENALKLYGIVHMASDTARNAGWSVDKIVATAKSAVPLAQDQAQALSQKVTELLAKTQREELNPDAIRRDIAAIIDQPGTALDIIGARLSHFDRDTVKALLAQTGLADQGRGDRIVDAILSGAATVREKYGSALIVAGQAQAQAGQAFDNAKEAARARIDETSQKFAHLKGQLDERIGAYIESYNAPELNYVALKHDIQDILHDPMELPHILRDRLSTFDHGTLDAVLRANPWIPAEQVRHIMGTIDETRHDLVREIAHLEDRATAAYEQTRRRAVIAAEHARMAASAAAWWVVWTAFLSGAAALGGAYFSSFAF